MIDETEMDQLPQLNDSENDNLIQMNGDGSEIEIGEDDAILNQLKSLGDDSIDDFKFKNQCYQPKGGKTANLDDLDKDQLLKMINQEVDGYSDDDDYYL